jgi:opacity protein-like surface antigen
MRRFLLAAVMVGAVSGAQAADMPDLPFLRGAFTDGLTTAKVNWQGFYVGGQAGLGTSDMNFTGATRTIAAHLLFGTAIENMGGVSSWPLGGKVSTHGNGIGGFAGYNAQWEDVVLGVEFNYMHGKFGGSQTDSMSRFFDAGGGYTDSVTYDAIGKMTISDMASARLRAGYAYGSFLPYLFGGVALGRADIIKTAHIYGNQINPNVAPPFDNVPFDLSATDARNSQLVYGYSFGLGVDVMLCAGLFLRAEWEYNRFTSAIDTSVNTGRVGLGYKF